MRNTILIACLSLLVGFTVKTTNLELDYKSDIGTTTADKIFIETEELNFEQNNFLADLELLDDGLQLKINGANILIKNGVDEFFAKQSEIQASIPYADIQNNSSEATVQNIFMQGKTNIDLEKVEMECDSGQRQEFYPLIDQCLAYGLVKAAKLNIGESSRIIALALNFNERQTTELKNLFLNINQGEITLSLKAKQGITVTVRIKAYAIRRNEVLDIKLKSAKASFLDIKNRILDEIKAMNSPNVTVEGDHILVSM